MDIYETYLGFLKDAEVRILLNAVGHTYTHALNRLKVSPPLAAILALTEIMERSNGALSEPREESIQASTMMHVSRDHVRAC